MSEINYCCISKSPFHSYSDVFASNQLTTYQIGRPDGPQMRMYNISEEEAKTICRNLPSELLEVVKEHYGLKEAAYPEGNNMERTLIEVIKEIKTAPLKEIKAICKELDIKTTGKTKDKLIESICISLLEDE